MSNGLIVRPRSHSVGNTIIINIPQPQPPHNGTGFMRVLMMIISFVRRFARIIVWAVILIVATYIGFKLFLSVMPYILAPLILIPAGLFFIWALRTRGMSVAWSTFTPTKNALLLLAGWTGLLIVPLLFPDTRDFWWGRITSLPGLVMIVLFTLYGYMMWGDPNKPFRWKLANWATGILVVVAVLYVFGEPLKEGYNILVASSTASTQVASTRPTQVRYIVAPVGKPSTESVDTLRGARIDSEGPIWIVDQSDNPHESGNDKEYPMPPMQTARFQSRTTVPMKVKVTVNQ